MTLIQAVVGSLILINRRQSTELFPAHWRKMWSDWEIRGLILISLTAQIVLVLLGNRRKHISKIWIRIIVWLAYLVADSVATMAMGVLSNDVEEINELTMFWAPFLLVHLGGMDTITAYSLEDNELWMRHSFGVIAQAVTTLYLLLSTWSKSSRLSPLFIVVFFVGLGKYCERVWALFSASEKRFRNSIPEILSRESKIMEECKLKQLEGYNITTHQVLEVEVPVSDNLVPNSDEANEILTAHSFFEMVKRLFADLTLGFQDRDASRAIFESNNMNAEKALKIIEIELGFMYDVMYTKAPVVYSSWGIARRIIGSLLILGVLVMVSLDETLIQGNSSKIDLTITLMLLVVALLLDLCSFAELILSDQTAHWLIKNKKTTTLQAINRVRTKLPTNWGQKRKRWSKCVRQFSLLSFCFATKVKPLFCHRILKAVGTEEIVEIYVYKSRTPPAPLYPRWIHSKTDDLPINIFKLVSYGRSFAEKSGEAADLKSLYSRRGGRALERQNHSDLEWSVKELEFHQSILIWHLATEILYKIDFESVPDNNRFHTVLHDRGKCMSRYMLYLLVEHPNMLPIGMGQIKFRDLYSDLGNFIEACTSKPLKDMTEKEASWMLIKEVNAENMLVGGGDRSSFVIFHGCKLAAELEKYLEMDRWETIEEVWLEMLCYAASQCKGRQHAQQLRRGGEFLTHIWLLMAHFGLTDHFQIPRSRAIANAVIR